MFFYQLVWYYLNRKVLISTHRVTGNIFYRWVFQWSSRAKYNWYQSIPNLHQRQKQLFHWGHKQAVLPASMFYPDLHSGHSENQVWIHIASPHWYGSWSVLPLWILHSEFYDTRADRQDRSQLFHSNSVCLVLSIARQSQTHKFSQHFPASACVYLSMQYFFLYRYNPMWMTGYHLYQRWQHWCPDSYQQSAKNPVFAVIFLWQFAGKQVGNWEEEKIKWPYASG